MEEPTVAPPEAATPEITTPDLARPAMTLAEGLAIHNARHPESRLTDITDMLAVDGRLRVLLLRHLPPSELREQVRDIPEEMPDPRARHNTLWLAAAVYLLLGVMPRKGWTGRDVHAALHGTGDPDRSRAILRHADAKMGLLRRLLWRGCRKRGEV